MVTVGNTGSDSDMWIDCQTQTETSVWAFSEPPQEELLKQFRHSPWYKGLVKEITAVFSCISEAEIASMIFFFFMFLTPCLTPREGLGSEQVSLKNTFLKASSQHNKEKVCLVCADLCWTGYLRNKYFLKHL